MWSILSLGILILAIYFLLQLSPVQQKIKEIVLQEITKKTKNKISIGNLRFRPFNRLQLGEVYVADLKNDTLFYVGKLNAGFDFLKMLRKKVVIHSVEIENFDLHIYRDSTNTPFNFQFLIDAFAADTTQATESSNLQLAMNHILLKNGRLHYDIFSEPFQAPGLFDANHIEVRNLQLDAGLHFNRLEDWNASVGDFSLNEKSGFSLNRMTFQIKNHNNRLQIEKFHILLPHSEAEIREADFDYPGLQLNEILSRATYSILFTSGKFYPADFRCFYSELSEYTDTVTCAGEIKGKFPEISVPQFKLNYGKQLQLALSAGIKDYSKWETSAFELNIKKCSVNPKLFGLPLSTDVISLTGKMTGSLPDLKLALSAASKQGNLDVNGTGGYDVSPGNIRFDFSAESTGYNLKTLLSDSVFGNASFRLAAQGTITALKKIDAKADAEISQLDYLGYSYRDITANATYANDSVSVDLISKDPHLPVTFSGKAGLNKENQFAHFYARFNNLRPDVLHLLPQYPGSELSGSIRADIKGFDPERMNASVAIENLHWSSPSGDFKDSPIAFSYISGVDGQKQINLRSKTLNVRGQGEFTYEGIAQSLSNAFPGLFPSNNSKLKKTHPDRENFDFLVGIRNANNVAHSLGMETTIPDSALFIGKYINNEENLNFDLTAYCVFFQSDTAHIHLNLSNEQHNLIALLDVKNKSDQYDLEGNTGAAIEFVHNPDGLRPDMNILLMPGSLTLNGASFKINPAEIAITNNKYEISNFALRHSTSEYIKIAGIISENAADSLQVNVSRFEIGTFLSILKNKVPLSGTASGDITLSRMMANPLVFTRNFTVDDMVFDGNPIGNLQLRSAWSSERQGVALRAAWISPDSMESIISGYALPAKDSLSLTANVQGIDLKWLNGYFPDYGLTGKIGAQIKVAGKLDNPDLTGTIYLNDATAGIPTLNTKYRVTDSVFLEKNQIVFRNCNIYDENNQNVKINGNIRHNQFSDLNPKLTLDFNKFLVLNNSSQTDSLFYGTVQISGNLSVALQNKDWLIQGQLSNERANKIMVNIPESAAEAQRYDWLTFVDKTERDSTAVAKERIASELAAVSLPLKFHITLSVTQGLTIGAVINPDTKDAATVTGRGILDFSYNLNNPVPNLMGTYTINDGKCTLSLKNITKKTFSVQSGGKLNFQGDIMNTTFDLAAMYSLRAYLTSLDPSFATIAAASKVPVNCVLSASGKMENMSLDYKIELPNQTDEIQRKLDGLIYTEDIKIKQIAYLLAFGSFAPINSNPVGSGNSSIWTSLASSSITSQLNHLLSGVLSDNWTIGTDLHTSDSNFSDIDMDVNISTSIFNDRVTLNSTLGYHNSTNQVNNFTGDFDIEYKLTPRGNLLLQFYNVTNNQYYDKSKSPLTQGVGIVYKRDARTFRKLFRSLRARSQSNS